MNPTIDQVTMFNTIFIEGGAYTDIKKALKQWLGLYKDIPQNYEFALYKNGRGNHLIIADKRLGNEQFNYLVNYLTYPEGIDYKVEVTGFTTISDTSLFPKEKKDIEILIFIPNSDTDCDNVYWVTPEKEVYKTDFGGKTIPITTLSKQYTIPEIDTARLPTPEIIRNESTKFNIAAPVQSQENIAKRVNVIVLIIAVLLFISFVTWDNRSNSITFMWIIEIATIVWFFTDYKMLQHSRFYYTCIALSIVILLYGYLIEPRQIPHNDRRMIQTFAVIPLFSLIIQKLLRHVFITIVKREPVVEKPAPSFEDFIYIFILMMASMLIPVLIFWKY